MFVCMSNRYENNIKIENICRYNWLILNYIKTNNTTIIILKLIKH